MWNIANNRAAFSALERLEYDIALLNEAAPTIESLGIWRDATEGRDGKKRPWSAAVLSGHRMVEIVDARAMWRGRAREVAFECSRAGSWIASLVTVAPTTQITAVALYGLMDEFADASVHRSLSEISPVMDDPRYSDMALIGGDLNVGTQWKTDDPFLQRDGNVLERLRAMGLVDCVAAARPPGRLEGCVCAFGDGCTHTRTRLDARWPDVPYQNDYLWASASLAQRLVSCSVLAGPEWFALSDHAPIVAEFDLS